MRILIVEDEDILREQLVERLRAEGYAVDATGSGKEGEYLGLEYPIDAAIVDLKMPGISGWEVTDHIKQVSPETFVIIHTGHGDMQQAIKAVRHRANDFLNKPCKLLDIQQALARALARVPAPL